jgi:hypothetical protein
MRPGRTAPAPAQGARCARPRACSRRTSARWLDPEQSAGADSEHNYHVEGIDREDEERADGQHQRLGLAHDDDTGRQSESDAGE